MKKMLIVIVALVSLKATAEVTLMEQNNWRVGIGGFIENDLISDSTRSFRETIGNSPVAAPGTAANANSRFQDSIRNSRLAFSLYAPQFEDWKTKAYFEFDLLGYDPAPTATSNNTESSFYNNPTMRPRHAYLKAENNGWEILAGQTWELFGFQPYYFMPTANVSPLPAMTYVRTAQLRGTKNWALGDHTLTSSIAMTRPPEVDAGLPDLQAGLRMVFAGRGSGFSGGGASGRKVENMSIAVSGLLRQINIPGSSASGTDTSVYTGSAISANIFVPILAAEEKNVSNTLSLIASYTQGSGYGDQFSGFSGGSASNLSATATANLNGRAAGTLPNLDAGLGDYDANNSFNLIQLTTFNVNLQYHLPADMPDWISAGVGVLTSNNMDSLVGTSGKTSGGGLPYDRERVYYANYFHEFTPQIRVAAEYDYIDTQYNGGASVANDIRYQITTYFMF